MMQHLQWYYLQSGTRLSLCHPHIQGILPKGPYLPCVSKAGRALLAGYHRHEAGCGATIWTCISHEMKHLHLIHGLTLQETVTNTYSSKLGHHWF